MQNDTPLTDDYVAELLAKDAAAVSARTTAGLGTASRRPPGVGAKPNIRFLKSIIRDADSHNEALKEREAEESRARLEALKPKTKRGRETQQFYSVRAHRGTVVSERKRRRLDDIADKETVAKHDRHALSGRKGLGIAEDDTGRDRKRTASDRVADYHEREPQSRSPRRHKSDRDHSSDRGRGRGRAEEASSQLGDRIRRRRSADAATKRPEDDSSDSSSNIGPRKVSQSPPLLQRGRGTQTAGISMNEHFEKSYDPSLDVRLPESDLECDDWDQALEALRDRQKWKKNGAERLKSAGFSDKEIATFKGGGKTDMGSAVTWSKKGEAREWDRGKTQQ